MNGLRKRSGNYQPRADTWNPSVMALPETGTCPRPTETKMERRGYLCGGEKGYVKIGSSQLMFRLSSEISLYK